MSNEFELDNTEAPAPAVKRPAGPTMLERLFAMTQRYHQMGNLRQATEMYWTMVSDHPDTPQAEAAKAELLLLAEGYERAGKLHMARGMYERLMDLED